MASLFGGGGEGGGIGGLLGIGGGGEGSELDALNEKWGGDITPDQFATARETSGVDLPGATPTTDWSALSEYMNSKEFAARSKANRARSDAAATPGAIPGYQNVSQVQRPAPRRGLLNTDAIMGQGMSQQGNGLQGLLALMGQARR